MLTSLGPNVQLMLTMLTFFAMIWLDHITYSTDRISSPNYADPTVCAFFPRISLRSISLNSMQPLKMQNNRRTSRDLFLLPHYYYYYHYYWSLEVRCRIVIGAKHDEKS